ncbi:hypothetical protein [Flavivirga spongiicola]|uniref:Lipocalin-like domain-containing protein n=1 Tax=Flavivirga spongiicola TaxID=421621 RepID=A0ABU7Y1I0_9FLAO|nr:hypothetical protein [Flavivirga sp. MEBiC05379]MDO5980989.1 hypothetical protein [Flavivirga sp. MEBiC05379]
MKTNLLFLTLISSFLISCSSDNDPIEEPLSIFGIWNSTSFIANEPLFDVNEDGVNSSELLDELPCRYSKLILNTDFTFYQENNTWFYNKDTQTYGCSTQDNISSVNGTWTVNSNYTLLSLEIDGNISFLKIELDSEVLQFNSSEIFINKNAQGEAKNIYGRAFYKRN